MAKVRLISAVLAALWLAFVPAGAQWNKTQATSNTAVSFPDNVVGAITPAIMRTYLDNLINSYQQFGGVNAQTGTTYTVALTDYGQLLSFNNAGSVAVSLPQATTGTGFSPFNIYVTNLGAGNVTFTPTISTINGASSFVLAPNQSAWIVSDGTNWQLWDAFTAPASFPAQSANTVLSGPTTGSAATPTFRAMVGADLPNPGASSKGGVQSLTCSSHQWLNTISVAGVPACSQPAFTDISGSVPNSQLANMTGPAIKGVTTGTTTPSDLSPGQVGSILCVPVRNVFTSGSAATYTVPTCNSVAATWIEVDVQGGGGGGSGSGTGTTGGAGTIGNASSFGALTASGGGNAASGATGLGGAGGACSGSLGTQQNFPGSSGVSIQNLTAQQNPGAPGGASFYGGQGVGVFNATGGSAPTNSGGGGAGGGGNGTANVVNGAGGGSGCHIKTIVTSPSATFTYTVGGTAAGGTAGTSGNAGGAGAAGLIDIIAHWQ